MNAHTGKVGTSREGAPTLEADEQPSTSVWSGEDKCSSSASSGKSARRSGLESIDGSSSRKAADLVEKIEQLRDQIKAEQTARDENVDEYLRMTAALSAESPDHPQLLRIRHLFERKNNKTAQNISQLQRKLDAHAKRLDQIQRGSNGGGEANGSSGITGVFGLDGPMSGMRNRSNVMINSVMNVPKDIANRLGLRHRAGSADNLSEPPTNVPTSVSSAAVPAVYTRRTTGSPLRDRPGSVDKTKSSTLPAGTKPPTSEDAWNPTSPRLLTASPPRRTASPKAASATFHADLLTAAEAQQIRGTSPAASYALAGTSPSHSLDPVINDLRQLRIAQEAIQDTLDHLKTQIQQEYAYFHQALHEEKYRYQKLEDQMHDLMELHQAEMLNLKQEITSMEDKVDYQNIERMRDIHDAVEHAQTRISKLEHAQQAQLFTGAESTGSAFVLKSFNVLILFLQCILVIVAALAQAVQPFLRSRMRVVTTALAFLSLAFLYQNREAIREAALRRAPV